MTTEERQPPEVPESRPTMEELVDDTPLRERIIASARSIRQALALAGTLILILGVLIWIFIRDLENYSYIVMGIGLVVLIVDAAISFDAVRFAIFGRRGRYGLNTAIVLIAFVAIAVVLNFFLYWAVGRPDPPGFLRIDTTSTKQFIVSDATLNTLSNLREPIQVTAFFRRNTPQRQAAWRTTEDLLSEFKRRSTEQPLTFRLVDPELEPNVAVEYGVTQFPSLAIEATESRRTEVIPGLNPSDGPNVFSEQDVITGLLVVNQIKQKTVVFISGHAVRDLLDTTRGGDGYSLAAESLVRENYAISNETLQELGQRLSSRDPELLPAAVIFAGPTKDMTESEEGILVEYGRRGGSFMFLLEPDTTPDSFKGFLSRYGVGVGVGTVVDTASYVAPNPTFLQVKNTNSQLPSHPLTEDFDVLYLPGSTYYSYSLDPETIPLTEEGVPYVRQEIVAISTLNSWSETDLENIGFEVGVDQSGPLPIAISVEAVAEIGGSPRRANDQLVTTQMVLVGDTDFASNAYFGSARNGDLFVNSVNYLADDYELITLRPKQVAFRELVLTESERNFVRWSGWLLMPILIALAGIWAWWRRR
jgi:hypothetical protein